MARSMQGLDLCRRFYRQVVQPVLGSTYPMLSYAAAVIGRGSEVLGFDDAFSRDHDWGPRVMLFIDESDHIQYGSKIQNTLLQTMPLSFEGYQVDFRSNGPVPHGGHLCCHCTEILTLRDFAVEYLNIDIDKELDPVDWLTIPQQKLLSVTAGAVFHDEVGLQAFRDKFAYYPRDVWLCMLAASWSRIGEEERAMGRAGSVGDEPGSSIIASSIVRNIMYLCFLMERQYAPYSKWLGTAFRNLSCAGDLLPVLHNVRNAQTWKQRQKHLNAAYNNLAATHNSLGITQPVQIDISPLLTRPYTICNTCEFAEAITAQITDPRLRPLALLGGIDQITDNPALLNNPHLRQAVRELYEKGAG